MGLRTESIRSGLEDWRLDLAMLLGIAMRPAMGLTISQAENGTLVFRTSQARSTGSQPPASLVPREAVCEGPEAGPVVISPRQREALSTAEGPPTASVSVDSVTDRPLHAILQSAVGSPLPPPWVGIRVGVAQHFRPLMSRAANEQPDGYILDACNWNTDRPWAARPHHPRSIMG